MTRKVHKLTETIIPIRSRSEETPSISNCQAIRPTTVRDSVEMNPHQSLLISCNLNSPKLIEMVDTMDDRSDGSDGFGGSDRSDRSNTSDPHS